MKLPYYLKLFLIFFIIGISSQLLKAEVVVSAYAVPALDSVKVVKKDEGKSEVKEIPKSKPQKRPEPVTPGKTVQRPKNIRPKGMSPGQIKRPGSKAPGKKN